MGNETTLVLIKPDAVLQDVWFAIMECYMKAGLAICRSKIFTMSQPTARGFYLEHEGRDYFEELIAHMTSGPIVALEITGVDAVARVRHLNGATNPAEAEEGTIRRQYGELVLGPKNAVHGSDSVESAAKAIPLIFF